MKRLALVAAIVFVFGQPYAQADDSHHPEKSQAGQPAATSQGMGMMDMDKMMERMQDMHKTMERIQQSKDAAERQRLMQEHMQQMHEMMGGMHGMMGMGKSTDERQQMMEKRMDMMQGMMEQMMEHMMAVQPAAKQDEEKKGDEHEHKEKK